MESQQVIKRPLHTEKSVADIRANNKYHFEIHPQATKNDVRDAVEKLFPDVGVVSVNTLRIPGKRRRMGWARGKTAARKKAVVELRPGDTIDIGY